MVCTGCAREREVGRGRREEGRESALPTSQSSPNPHPNGQIGSGIFASAGTAITEAGSPGAALLAWVVAAVLVVMGSFCYGELAVQMPSASGDAEYLRRAYGNDASFLFGEESGGRSVGSSCLASLTAC